MLPTRTNMGLLLLSCILLATSSAAYAQYQIQSWTTESGLPQNTIHSILQTPDGYLWLATLDGVVRFDGVRFKVFNKNNTPGIEGNRFTQMLVAGGDLWIGTEEFGATRYREGAFQTFPVPENKPIKNLVLNLAGDVLALTTTGDFRWDGEKFVSYTPDAAGGGGGETGKILALWDKAGAYEYFGKNELPVFKGRPIGDYLSSNSAIIGSAENIQFNKLFEDRRGRLWMGTKDSGLLMLDENGKLTVYKINDGSPANVIRPYIEDRDGNLWAIDLRRGAVIINPEGEISVLGTGQGLSDQVLTSIYEDREGNIWVGSTFGGLNRLNKQSVAFYSKKEGLAVDVTRLIYQTRDGDIWIGGAKLTRWRDNEFSPVIGVEKDPSMLGATAIMQDRAGRLWFGHWGGAYYYENGRFTDFTETLGSKTTVTAIYEDRLGVMWFGTENGVFRYQNGAMTTRFTTADGLAGNNVKFIHESPDGTLWFGTYGGLSRFKDGAFSQPLTTADGLASNQVRSIYEDSDGVLWVGTYDGGLARFKDGKFTRYTTKDGLFNDGVFRILEDDAGNFWMSCNLGIYRVARQQLNEFADGKRARIESTSYGKADGLLETECNGGHQPAGIRARDGRLWFPTQRGVAVIDPKTIETNPYAPPVLVQTYSLDRNDPAAVSSGSMIEILPDIENLEIAYTALSFIKPEQVRFKYKMSGIDRDWVEAGSRRAAYYTHLPPGEYVFTVIAANSDGVWNTEGASILVRVVPPFYRTWWFLILSLALICLTIFLLYRRRVERLEQAHRAQEEFSRKLFASQEQERQRIAAELHDSIGQSLLIIKNRAFLALNDLEEPEVVREQLEELSESATGAIEECREISYNLRPYQINRFGLTKTLEAIFRRISEVSKIETIIDTDSIDDVFSAEAEINIFRVVQESVNNIIKHSQASEALFVIRRRADDVEILIKDSGRGFDKNSVDKNGSGRSGFGLIGMTERVRMLGGVYRIESQPGQGTIIKIKLTILATDERN